MLMAATVGYSHNIPSTMSKELIIMGGHFKT
jgi:hypothetical protein